MDNNDNAIPKASEGDLFSYKLEYESAGFYDGNIGKQYWQSANDQNQAIGLRSYTMTYDPLKRITGANFAGIGSENYSLSGLTYDKNGNIKTMQRNGKTSSGFGLMDNLNYTYDGNKLNQVTDGVSATDNEVDLVPRGSGNYTYYTDGSVKSDENEGISLIIYDTFLRQPKEIQLTESRKINYYYNGAGALLKTVYSTGEYWEFTPNGMIYKNGQPYQMAVPEGRAIYINGSWQYEFFYTDHLGNTRVAFRANGNQLIKTSETAFDPWGVVLRGAGQVNGVINRFEYQNKESEKTFGLNRINLGARIYNPTNGRFLSVDPRASEMSSWSPYSAFFGNPLRYIDPDGEAPKDIIPILARNGATGINGHYAGHIGVLIGSDKNGWTFISKEGRDKSANAPWYSNELTGGPALPPKVISFKTKSEFDKYKSEHMSEYTEEVRFKTTEEQDKKATKAAIESGKTWYNAFCNNCADTVSDALEAAGLDGGTSTSTTPTPNAPASQSLIPNVRYDNMKKNNANLIVPEPPKQKVVPNQSN